MGNYIVSGAGGFIGGNLVSRLLYDGSTVYGIDIAYDKLKKFEDNSRFVPVLTDDDLFSILKENVRENSIDAFFHLAWRGYGKDTNNFDVQIRNVEDTYKAVTAAGKIGCKKFVMACSSHEYQKNCYGNTEGNRIGSCSIYGASKTAAKAYAKVEAHNYDMDFNGAIFTNVFGVGDYSKRTANVFISKLLKNEDLNLIKGNRLYDWTYIDDVAEGLAAIGKRGIDGKEYYVGSGQLRPFRDIIEDAHDILGSSSKLNFGVYPDTSYIDYSKINIYELYEDTGCFPKCRFSDSIKKSAQWVKKLDL